MNLEIKDTRLKLGPKTRRRGNKEDEKRRLERRMRRRAREGRKDRKME